MDLKTIIRDLRALADDLEKLEVSPAPAATSKEVSNVTLEEVRGVLAKKSQAGFGEDVRNLIKSYGADKLSSVDPTHYPEMLQKAEVIGNAR